jgi:hypothetical protein
MAVITLIYRMCRLVLSDELMQRVKNQPDDKDTGQDFD